MQIPPGVYTRTLLPLGLPLRPVQEPVQSAELLAQRTCVESGRPSAEQVSWLPEEQLKGAVVTLPLPTSTSDTLALVGITEPRVAWNNLNGRLPPRPVSRLLAT